MANLLDSIGAPRPSRLADEVVPSDPRLSGAAPDTASASIPTDRFAVEPAPKRDKQVLRPLREPVSQDVGRAGAARKVDPGDLLTAALKDAGLQHLRGKISASAGKLGPSLALRLTGKGHYDGRPLLLVSAAAVARAFAEAPKGKDQAELALSVLVKRTLSWRWICQHGDFGHHTPGMRQYSGYEAGKMAKETAEHVLAALLHTPVAHREVVLGRLLGALDLAAENKSYRDHDPGMAEIKKVVDIDLGQRVAAMTDDELWTVLSSDPTGKGVYAYGLAGAPPVAGVPERPDFHRVQHLEEGPQGRQVTVEVSELVESGKLRDVPLTVSLAQFRERFSRVHVLSA